MKIADVLRSVQTLFLDTAPVIYYVEQHPVYGALVEEIFARIDAGDIQAVTSPITLLECLVVPLRLGQASLVRDFTDLIARGYGTTFTPINEAIASRGAELRATYNLTLADAIQVATALVVGCGAVLTNDSDLKRVREISILALDDLEL